MHSAAGDIELVVEKNDAFRKVLYTASHSHLVVLAVRPGEETGVEMQNFDQFLRLKEGGGEAILNGIQMTMREGFAIIVPAGVAHNIVNTGRSALILHSLYSQPSHPDGAEHARAIPPPPAKNAWT